MRTNNTTEEQYKQALNTIAGMKEISAPDFFYTRLKARMEKEINNREVNLSIKPVLVVCTLAFFVFINTLIIKKDAVIENAKMDQNIEALAASYDQIISK